MTCNARRRLAGLVASVLAACLVSACGNQDSSDPDAAVGKPQAHATALESGPASDAPSFGGVTQVSREVEGIGSTPELAVLAALQSAITQVNGLRVGARLQSLRAGLGASSGGAGTAVEADGFIRDIRAASGGAVLGYEILSQEEIDKVDEEVIAKVRASDEGYSFSASSSSQASAKASARSGDRSAEASARHQAEAEVEVERGASSYSSDLSYRRMRSYWRVRVRADIAKYEAPADDGRPRLVVARPRVAAASYLVGDDLVASEDVADEVRSRLSDILSQTQRFIVLDREFGDELQDELDHIASGNVRLADAARMGQQLATDLILVPIIERFEYPRSTRRLRMSGREVASYAGGGRMTLRLLNATTGQVVMSDSFQYELPSTGPSTLPRFVDGKAAAAEMMDALARRIGTAVVAGIFPISVVAVEDGQVVLSQGGEMLREGEVYEAVGLGAELKDPQTGRSLGRRETPCCTIRIDRVGARTAYGTIVAGTAGLPDFESGSIELRRHIETAVTPPTPAPLSQSPKPVPAKAGNAPTPTQGGAGQDDPNW